MDDSVAENGIPNVVEHMPQAAEGNPSSSKDMLLLVSSTRSSRHPIMWCRRGIGRLDVSWKW